MSSWFGGAGKLLSGASQLFEDVLAVSGDTPLDKFKSNWENFQYTCAQSDADEATKYRYAEEQLDAMVKILVDESNEEQTKQDGGTGPVLEYFLSERVMETLWAFAKTESPTGVASLVMNAFSTMLKEIKDPLIPNVNVHGTLMAVIVHSLDEPDKVVSLDHKFNFVSFLANLASRLEEHPDYFSIFFRNTAKKNGASGEGGGSGVDFVLFSALVPFLNDEQVITQQRAREGLLSCLQLHKQEITEFVVRHTEFAAYLMNGLTMHFYKMPESAEAAQEVLSTQPLAIEDFYEYAQFLNQVAQASHPQLREQIAEALHSEFLCQVLQPRLLEASEGAIVNATIHLSGLVEALNTSENREALVHYLLGAFVGPETPAQRKGHLVRKTLIHRVMYMEEKTALATLQLFEDLVDTCDQAVVYNLVARNLLPAGTEGSLFEEPPAEEDAEENTDKQGQGEGGNAWLELFAFSNPEMGAGESGTHVHGYDAYLVDAQQNVGYAQLKCKGWLDEAKLQEMQEAMQTEEEAAAQNETLDDDGIEAEGLFLSILLDKLEVSLESSMNANAVLTGILSRLAQLPVASLHNYFLEPVRTLGAAPGSMQGDVPAWKMKDEAGVRTVYSVLQQVAEQAKEEASRIANFGEIMQEARRVLQVGADDAQASQEDITSQMALDAQHETFVQALVVLEEFCKEMAAVQQVIRG